MSYFCKLKGKFSPLLSQAGLSLLETAVGLIIVGLIVLPIMQAYQQKLAAKAYDTNLGNLNEVLDGINQFFVSGHNFYPCPTDLSLAEGDGGFGASNTNCTPANFSTMKRCDDPTWLVNGGVCRTSDIQANAVIIGGVPFADLKMTSEEALDFWGNKIIYAVSFTQTDVGTYVHEGGTIDVMSVDDPQLVAAGPASNPDRDGIPDIWPDPQDIVLFSTGERGIGGYTRNGIALTACGSGAVITREDENCDFDDVFFGLSGPEDTEFNAYSEADNSSYFDDMTVLQRSPPVGTWFQHDKNPLYVSNNFVLTGATKISVGSADNNPGDPFPEVNLEVEGDIRADVIGGGVGGHLRSDRYCGVQVSGATSTIVDCLDPQYITDAMDSMNCINSGNFSDEVIRGVRKISGSAATSSVGCSTGTNTAGSGGIPLQVDNSKFSVVDCDADGKVAIGISAAGDVICASIP